MSQQLAKRNSGNELAILTLKQTMDKCTPNLIKAMPKGFGTPEKVKQQAMIACNLNQDLYKCDPFTIVACMIQSTMLRLMIGGPLGQSYMIPYKDQANFQVGYKGMIQLAHNSGQVKAFYAHTRYENDEFYMELGTEPRVIHKPSDRDRGKPIGYYAVIQTINNGKDFEYMSHEQVEEHRDKYSKMKNGPAWTNSFDQMAQKTVIRRIAKRCPVATELQFAASMDEYGEQGLDQGISYLVEGVEPVSRVGQIKAKLMKEEQPVQEDLDAQIIEALGQTDQDWAIWWTKNGRSIMKLDPCPPMSLEELAYEEKVKVLEHLNF